jgi:hypothetical protein
MLYVVSFMLYVLMFYVVCFMLLFMFYVVCLMLNVMCFSVVFVFQGEINLTPSPQHLLTSESNVLILKVLHVSTVKWPSSGHYFLQKY